MKTLLEAALPLIVGPDARGVCSRRKGEWTPERIRALQAAVDAARTKQPAPALRPDLTEQLKEIEQC